MSAPDTFRNILAQSFADNVDHLSLHTASPGADGANDSGISHAVLSWSAPAAGITMATGRFDNVTGVYLYVGLWNGATFRQGLPCKISYTAPANLAVLITHEVSEDEV